MLGWNGLPMCHWEWALVWLDHVPSKGRVNCRLQKCPKGMAQCITQGGSHRMPVEPAANAPGEAAHCLCDSPRTGQSTQMLRTRARQQLWSKSQRNPKGGQTWGPYGASWYSAWLTCTTALQGEPAFRFIQHVWLHVRCGPLCRAPEPQHALDNLQICAAGTAAADLLRHAIDRRPRVPADRWLHGRLSFQPPHVSGHLLSVLHHNSRQLGAGAVRSGSCASWLPGR